MSNLPERFHDLYRGSDTHHGETWLTGRTLASGKAESESGTYPGPATPQLWERHLAGLEPSIGIRPVQTGDRVRFGVLDIDAYAGLDHQAIFWRLPSGFHVIRSKSLGAHCTVFSDDVPRKLMHSFLLKVCEVTGLQEFQPSRAIETFPEDTEGAGQWINAPYNGPDSIRVSINGAGESATPEDFLDNILRISEKQMREYVGTSEPATRKRITKREPAYKTSPEGSWHYPEGRSEMGRWLKLNLDATDAMGRAKVLEIMGHMEDQSPTKQREYQKKLTSLFRDLRERDRKAAEKDAAHNVRLTEAFRRAKTMATAGASAEQIGAMLTDEFTDVSADERRQMIDNAGVRVELTEEDLAEFERLLPLVKKLTRVGVSANEIAAILKGRL